MYIGQNSGGKFTRDLVYFQTKEILDLGAGDDDRNAVRETNDDRTRYELDRRSQTCHAQEQKDHPSHQGAHEQPVNPVFRDNAKNHDDECARRTADLG